MDSNAPRANKRFLSSIIKSTDEHNKTILKAQAQAAEDLKRERREQERRQRKVRAEEAASAERLRRHGKRRHTDDDEVWDRWDGKSAERKKRRRSWDTWDYELDSDRNSSSRKRRRSRSSDKVGASKLKRSRVGEEEVSRRGRSKRSTGSDHEPSPRRKLSPHRSRDKRDDHQSRRRRDREATRRHSHPSESHSRASSTGSSDIETSKARKRRPLRSPKYALDDLRGASSPEPSRHSPLDIDSKAQARETELKERLKDSREADKSGQGSLHNISNSRHSLTPMTMSRSPSPGPRPPEHVPSKMDRYFEESYDPRLDVEPLAVPQVPATGLVSDADFEGWDAMLELIRLRREDKVEKKRLERLGILPPKDKIRKSSSACSSAAVAERWNVEGVSVMDIAYNKKGTVREWDLGKEGF